jgi:hypothetical protein
VKVKVKVKVEGTGHSRDSSRRETGLSSGVLQPQKKEACRVSRVRMRVRVRVSASVRVVCWVRGSAL